MLSVVSRDAALCAPGNNTNILAWEAYQTPNSASANGVTPRCSLLPLQQPVAHQPTNYILWFPWEPRGAYDLSRFFSL